MYACCVSHNHDVFIKNKEVLFAYLNSNEWYSTAQISLYYPSSPTPTFLDITFLSQSMIFYHVNILHFIFLFFYQHLVSPQFFSMTNIVAVNIHVCVSGCPVREQGMFLEAELLGCRVETVLVFTTCCQIAMKIA